MIPHAFNHNQARLVTLRFSILSIFITLFIAMILLIIFFTSYTLRAERFYTAIKMMNYASADVSHLMTDGFIPAERDSRFSAYFIKNHMIATDPATLIPYTRFLIMHYPLAIRAYWADTNGHFISSEKNPDGTISSHVYTHTTNAHFTVSDLLVFKQAQTKKDFFWSDVHRFQIIPVIGVSAVTPVYNGKKFIGIFVVNIDLSYLSTFLTQQKITPNSYSFLIDRNENLIAYPNRPPFTESNVTPGQLINVHAIKLPIVDAAIDQFKKTNSPVNFITNAGIQYLVSYLPIAHYADNHYLIGTVVPLSDFTSILMRMNTLNLISTLVVLCIGIILVSSLVTRVVRPINRLVKEANKIKQFHLDHHIYFPSRIKEVVLLRNAFESMRLGLRQFQRYVPKALVRQLIESGNDTHVGGVRSSLVIFFSDVRHFTSIAEKMDPNELMFQVCEYFESLTRIIIDENKGTLDKYIGDAIMAFWGAPVPEHHPCTLAATAALACLKKVRELNQQWDKENKPPFETFFGIHMGMAIVGNVGSSERLNYTALGDTINIANRLQDINRFYGTHILVSDIVHEHLKDDFAMRPVDKVVVRGRYHPLFIYELLGTKDDSLAFDLNAYTEAFSHGFDAYQNEEWQAAKDYFNQCLAIYPKDTVAPIFIERCEKE